MGMMLTHLPIWYFEVILRVWFCQHVCGSDLTTEGMAFKLPITEAIQCGYCKIYTVSTGH